MDTQHGSDTQQAPDTHGLYTDHKFGLHPEDHEPIGYFNVARAGTPEELLALLAWAGSGEFN